MLPMNTNQELLTGHYVYVNMYKCFFKIGEVEPFQYDTGQETTAIFSEVAASGSSGNISITEIEPDDKPRKNLFQALVGVQYGFKYYFKVDTGTSRFGTDTTKGIGFLDTTISPFYAPNKDYQMWFVNNYYPAVSATNGTSYPLTPKIRFMGFKYELVDIDDTTRKRLESGQMPYKHITIGGLK